ncbi:hypothetical protein KIL84_005804 [Mauremys mutica]|uniref:Uncharacterized protein n=1 Tax=Mauremys mutica TaxID=74926 RepID=A0A9D3XDT6_9SAUR|nr:hypothetical protein KIL84_005804 [Mauremys mutica]
MAGLTRLWGGMELGSLEQQGQQHPQSHSSDAVCPTLIGPSSAQHLLTGGAGVEKKFGGFQAWPAPRCRDPLMRNWAKVQTTKALCFRAGEGARPYAAPAGWVQVFTGHKLCAGCTAEPGQEAQGCWVALEPGVSKHHAPQLSQR